MPHEGLEGGENQPTSLKTSTSATSSVWVHKPLVAALSSILRNTFCHTSWLSGAKRLQPLPFRIMETTEEGDNEETAVTELRSELWLKERELTDIRLEALSSAHQLEQLREAMNSMQVCFASMSIRVNTLVCEFNILFPCLSPSQRWRTWRRRMTIWKQGVRSLSLAPVPPLPLRSLQDSPLSWGPHWGSQWVCPSPSPSASAWMIVKIQVRDGHRIPPVFT